MTAIFLHGSTCESTWHCLRSLAYLLIGLWDQWPHYIKFVYIKSVLQCLREKLIHFREHRNVDK